MNPALIVMAVLIAITAALPARAQKAWLDMQVPLATDRAHQRQQGTPESRDAAPSDPGPPDFAGSYVCSSASCQTGKPIVLNGAGGWSWGGMGGAYSVAGAAIRFAGGGSGPAGWGPAEIGDGRLVFHSGRGDSVWLAGAPAAAAVACNPNLPDYRQPGCQHVAQPAPPAYRCNPDIPHYSQPGCVP